MVHDKSDRLWRAVSAGELTDGRPADRFCPCQGLCQGLSTINPYQSRFELQVADRWTKEFVRAGGCVRARERLSWKGS
jgi:hypothetical protein